MNIFDCNMHVTITSNFKDYKRNVPATFENYRKQFNSPLNLVGCIHSGLPNFESYSLNSFAKLSHQDDLLVYAFPALTKDSLSNLDIFLSHIKDLGFKGCKLHPRLLSTTFSALDLFDIYKHFSKHGLCLMLCSLCLGEGMSNLHHIEYLKFLEYTTTVGDHKSKIIIAHAGASWFINYFEFAQYVNHVLLDLSFTLARYRSVYLDQFLYAINSNKNCLAFGSDWPDFSLTECLEPLSPILNDDSSRIAINNFLANNALNFLSTT
jgi:predicted TIM-barrel fold metal-dependent hydrolase